MDEKGYDIGDEFNFTATFLDKDKEPKSPTEVTLRVRKPDGTVVTPFVTPGDEGVYTAEIDLDQHGRWRYGWRGTGVLKAYREGYFDVRRKTVPPASP